MLILRDWDLLAVLLHQLLNQRGYWVEGQRGSVRVCPASTAELPKCSFFFVQRTKPWLLGGYLGVFLNFFLAEVGGFFQLLYTNLDSFLLLKWIFLCSNHLIFMRLCRESLSCQWRQRMMATGQPCPHFVEHPAACGPSFSSYCVRLFKL